MLLGQSELSPKILENFQNDFTPKWLNGPPICYDFFNRRIKIDKIGMLLGQSEVSPKILGNFQNDFTQKRLDGPLRFYYFLNQRMEI